MLIKDVYEAIRNGPQWNDTLFIVTYDEHGGFYDHETPPTHGIPNPDGRKGYGFFDFDRLGARVPTIMVIFFRPLFSFFFPTPLFFFLCSTLKLVFNFVFFRKVSPWIDAGGLEHGPAPGI